AVLQTGVAAAAHDLEQLRGELDLPDPAATELDVQPLAARLALAGFAADQGVHRAQPIEDVVVEIATEYEGRHDLRQRLLVVVARRLAGHAGIGDDLALEPGEAFPLAAL